MNSQLFRQALEQSGFNTTSHREAIREKTSAFLQKYRVADELIEFFAQFSFDRPIQLGHVDFDQVNDFEAYNLDEVNHYCIKAGLLIIGRGLNGDPIVVDVSTLEVGFVFHDRLYEEEVSPREVLVNMNCSIGEFYLHSVQLEDYPVDAYQAEEYMKKKNE
jgi:hypothetical protein